MAECENIEVTVKTLDSQTRSFTVEAEITVKDFKEHIATSVSIPSEKQRLIYQGRVLQDDKKLKDYNVDGKVIHLVERAPPQAQPSTGVPSGASTSSTNNGAGRVGGPSVHDRNANSYVMVGTFNLPVSITDTQQIQQSVQQVMSGLGEAGRNPRVTTASGNDGSSIGVHINVEQHAPIQSEPRLRLVMAQHMLRDVQRIVARLEGPVNGGQQESTPQTSQEPPTEVLEVQETGGIGGIEAEAMDIAEAAAEAAAREHGLETSFRVTVRMGQTTSTTSATSGATTYAAAAATAPATAAAPAAASASFATSTSANDAPANHPSPSDYGDVLQELRGLESRLSPFLQRYQDILGNATTADYNNNTEGREEDQRTINLVGECLRLLGNTFVALSDLRCNLSTNTPRHLHVVRPMSHYTAPMVLQQAAIPIQINTVTMTGNGARGSQTASEGQESQASQTAAAQAIGSATTGDESLGAGSEGQGQPPPAGTAPTQTQASQTAHPRMIRITRQTVEPVVMMHMNMQDSGSPTGEAGSTPSATPGQGPGAAGATHLQMPTLPTEFIQAITHQITQQAMAMAAATGQPVSGVPGFPPAPTRVVFARPTAPTVRNIQPRAPPPAAGTAQLPGNGGNAPLAQMISGLVGQILMQPVLLGQGSDSDPASTRAPSSSSSSTSSYSSSTSSTSSLNPSWSFSATSSMSTSASATNSTTPTTAAEGCATTTTIPQGPDPTAPPSAELQFSQLLGNILGAAGSGVAGVAGLGTPTVTVAMPGVPAFLQGMTEIFQVPQNISSPQTTPTLQTANTLFHQQPPPQFNRPSNLPAGQECVGNRPTIDQEAFPPEFFTSVVQGVLSSMMGSLNAQHGSTESIADFIQRLSGSTNIFEPGVDGALGFFGDLLSLICQNFSMVDIVMLLHGQFQPLQRIQPQLNQFFREEFLHNQEPTEQNTRTATDNLINGLEEYIRESFASVRVLEGVDITRTNLEFLQEQFNGIATHILHCTDSTFGSRLLELCNQGLFECLALNLYCLRGEQRALTAVINERIRLMSSDVNGSMVNWLTTMMGMRLQVILEQMPVTEEQILHYVRRTSDSRQQVREEPMDEQPVESAIENMQRENSSASPVPATTAEEVMPAQPPPIGMEAERPQREEADSEPWAASVPPEWVPIIRQDIQTQRKMKQQPALSDAYLSGMPAKRRKTMQGDGPQVLLSEAVSRAAKATGTKPMTSSDNLNEDLEEIQDNYREQLRTDVQKRIRGDPNYSPQRFPNTHSVFEEDS